MNPMLVIGAILGAFILILLLALDATKPKFYKLNETAKKAEKRARKTGTANIVKLRKSVNGAYLDKKIDGMEKEYLFQRIKVIEDLIIAKIKPDGPKYAAGGPMDKL